MIAFAKPPISEPEPPSCDCDVGVCSYCEILQPTGFELTFGPPTGEPCVNCQLIAAALRQVADRLDP